ncbi:MAG: CHASE2 domain-containing protein [Moorea sp. SIO2B7]|nr:CHASE2 domain-containing protein [Moorena sp. SIO2B7]
MKQQLRQKVRQWWVVLVTTPTIAGLVVAVSLTGWLQLLEWAALDLFFRLRPPESSDSRIVIVGINESDIQEIGKWPISDEILAKLLNQLKKQKPRVIGLDIYRDLPVEPGNQQLVKVFKSTPNLVGVEKINGDPVPPPPILSENQVGFLDLVSDADGRIRRGWLSQKLKGQNRLSLGAKLALIYLAAEDITLQKIDNTEYSYHLGKAEFHRFEGNDGGYVRAEDKGNQIILNFRGMAGSFPTVSLSDVLENRISPDLIRDHIVLIGTMAPSKHYLFYTPYSTDDSSAFSGVEIHAHLTSQIISAAIDGRPLINTWSDPLEWLWILFWSGCGAGLGSMFLCHRRVVVISIFLVGGSLIGISYLAFLEGWWLIVFAPLLAISGSSIVSITYTLLKNLKLYHQELEEYAQTLEQKVEERTKQLRRSEERFAKAFRSSPSPITISSLKDGKHIEVNKSFLDITGYKAEEVIGHTAPELNLWVNIEDRLKLFEKLKNEREVHNYEFTYRTKSGEVKTAILSAEIIFLQEQECLLAISNDITERKQAEEILKQAKEAADAASKIKSEFLASMSHELRTPLNAILGFSRLLARIPSPNEEHSKYLDIIRNSGEHLLSLINDVLDLSKIEAGRITLNENIFNLYSLVETIEGMFRLKAQEKGLQLIFVYKQELPQYIKTDEKKLRQVLINLLENAIKFTQNGYITMRVIGDCNLKNATLKFEIEDTGAGISSQEVDNLFEAFVQTETGRTSQEGTGLGLPISRKFVQLMGGDISVNSTLGKGTTFKFDIQVDVVNGENIATQETRRIIGLASNQPIYRILIVDDIWDNCQLLFNLLKPLGFEVKEAENGKQALELWESWHPHLIWMDIQMPVMDGYEATRQIRKREQQQKENFLIDKLDFKLQNKVIIIALSASVFEEDRERVILAGCNDFVTKPFAEEMLFEKMAEYLGLRYLYEDISETKSSISTEIQQDLTVEDLAVMSADWVAQLNQAAIEGNDEIIFQLIEQIPTSAVNLANTLTAWTNDFRFDKITDLIEQKIL